MNQYLIKFNKKFKKMNLKYIEIKIARLFISLLIIYPKLIYSQSSYTDNLTAQIASNCKKISDENRVKEFSDCNKGSNLENMQICCYYYGVNADKSHTEGCIAVNSTLFSNKSITYSSSGISGSLICTDNYTFSNYINISLFNLFLLIITLLFM